MINDPELNAMSKVYDALQSLDESTQRRVVEWVMTKLQSTSSASGGAAKRGRKPGSGAKRGPKPGSKRGRKRGPKPGSGGRPKGTVGRPSARRGRPRKNPISAS